MLLKCQVHDKKSWNMWKAGGERILNRTGNLKAVVQRNSTQAVLCKKQYMVDTV